MASNVEDILRATIDGETYEGNVESRVEELLVELKEAIEEGGGGGGDYETLHQYIYDTYRRERKNITAKVQNGDFDKAVHEQDLAKYGISIGDYFTDINNYTYYVADMNTLRSSDSRSSSGIYKNHAFLLLDTKTTSKYHTSNVIPSNGYIGCYIHTNLNTTIAENVKTGIATLTGDAWSDHIVRREIRAVNGTLTDVYITSGVYLSLLSPIQVFGSADCNLEDHTKNLYLQGEALKKLAIFDKFSFGEFVGYNGCWLRTFYSDAQPNFIHVGGYVMYDYVNALKGQLAIVVYKAKGD